jgi:hypothetical protein
MKASELINQLKDLIYAQGDLEIVDESDDFLMSIEVDDTEGDRAIVFSFGVVD